MSRPASSAPFANRELNGEHLLDELSELRAAQTPQRALDDLSRAVKELAGTGAAEASASLKEMAASRFAATPAVAALMVRWAAKLKSETDVTALGSHLQRLALVGAMLGAFRRAADRLPRGGAS